MKNILPFAVFLFALPAMAATGRVGVQGPVAAANNRVSPAKMASMSISTGTTNATESVTEKSSIRYEETTADVPSAPQVDKREKEKNACIQNNIGVGNTFVWASRYSNTNDYATMIEDTENPENNTCFVKVSIKSNDSRINLDDIRDQYYEMGRGITCGAWADEAEIEKRILDAKKKARTWATVGGAVGGAAVGVGSMELFGNRAIGGAVEGQKDLERKGQTDELLRSQLLALKKDNSSQYNEIVSELGSLKKSCDKWDGPVEQKPSGCERYKSLFSIVEQ